MDRDCKDCVFHSRSDVVISLICEYPVPEYIRIHTGGGFVSGYEAKRCATYKDKAELVKEAKLGVGK